MDKLSLSNRAIEPQEKPSCLVRADERERKELISEYLEKYALIANRAVTPQLMALYVEALQDVPLRRIEAGLKFWLREGDKWPWPSDLREASEL